MLLSRYIIIVAFLFSYIKCILAKNVNIKQTTARKREHFLSSNAMKTALSENFIIDKSMPLQGIERINGDVLLAGLFDPKETSI